MNKILIFITLLSFLSFNKAALTFDNQTVLTFENIDFSHPNPIPAVAIIGIKNTSSFQKTVSKAGDVNGDGIDDFMIANPESDILGTRLGGGVVYVIFGNKNGFPNIVDFRKLSLTQGFAILGAFKSSYLGQSVSAAGDVNGDGIDDIIIGTTGAYSRAGVAYVIFGTRTPRYIDLAVLSPSQGFKIVGSNSAENFGVPVSGVGDINGDGIDDIIVGESYASPLGRNRAGAAYVIFGRKDGLSDINITALNSTQGFTIMGSFSTAYFGEDLSGAGDFNGDGIDDIVGLSDDASHPVCVIFGKNGSFSDIDLATFNSTQGVGIKHELNYGFTTARSSGDVNGDGIDDIIIGDTANIGHAYIVYGSRNLPAIINIDNINISQGFTVSGADYNGPWDYYIIKPPDSMYYTLLGSVVCAAGDVNNDGIDDIIIGAPQTTSSKGILDDAGAAYVIFGNKNGLNDINVTNLTSNQGFSILGVSNDLFYKGLEYMHGNLGNSVSSVGDVDGDGIADFIVAAYRERGPNADDDIIAYVFLSSRNNNQKIIV